MNYYIRLFHLLFAFFDQFTNKKICNFFKKKIKNKKITLIDVGGHKGETINLYSKNFTIDKIYSFEPNPFIYKNLKAKSSNNVFTYNLGVGNEEKTEDLNIVVDSQSSTFNKISEQSKYFLLKKKLLLPFSKKKYSFKKPVKIIKLSNFIDEKNISKIDILKIDTEGYEYKVLKGIKNDHFKLINFILLEHHYDNMIDKDYSFSDICNILKKNNFSLKFKSKMYFRKTFEYIFENLN